MKIGNKEFKTMKALKEKYVLVKVEEVERLKSNDIGYIEIEEEGEQYFIVRRGARHKKFTEELCKKIRAEREEGKTYKELALKYDCSTRIINYIIRGIY